MPPNSAAFTAPSHAAILRVAIGRSDLMVRHQTYRIGRDVDVPSPEGFQPLASYKIANNYREFMTSDKLVAELRKRFEGYTGPPINKGGVR